ncbi:MAG TPA: glycosyltransferase [Bryobacteraceae bacterium]|jgi:glycosyltransferase involved in cell wall biosynthesis
MRSAIVHYWLLGMRGGEKVVESLCRILPDADVFTLFYDPERIAPGIRSHRIFVSSLDRYRRHYRSLLPLMPLALESFDLRGYDLVVSSESGPAKGVLTAAGTRHVCYCHSPMRYLWDLYPAYLHEWSRSSLKRLFMAPLANYLRLWDYASAARVDDFVANSHNVQDRIVKAYRRSSRVVYPPVEVETFFCSAPEDYYLIVSELVAYKRVADAIECFTRSGRRLKIAGSGPEYAALKRRAGRTIEFCGRVSDSELRSLYARARAVLMPGEEDFGIVAVEALASGKPLIGLGRGGLVEIAPPCPGAFLYREPGASYLQTAVERFERQEPLISPGPLQAAAVRFSETRFRNEMEQILFGDSTPPSHAAFVLQKVHKSPTTIAR